MKFTRNYFTKSGDLWHNRPMPALSKRLKLIFDQLIPGEPVWDICCDHGYLGLAAYESNRFSEVNFVDQVPQIIQRLEETFNQVVKDKDNHTRANFIARAGEHLSHQLNGNVVICGVGSYSIFQIVKSLQEKNLLKARRLILCPQNDVVKIEDLKKLPDFTYRQLSENLVVNEKDRLREIYVLDQVSIHT